MLLYIDPEDFLIIWESLAHLPFKIIILFSSLEPCALHLDIFINELKQLPMLHDSACFVSQGEKEISTLQRLAMP